MSHDQSTAMSFKPSRLASRIPHRRESDETAPCSQNIVRQGAVSMREDGLGSWIFRRKWFVLTEQTLDIHGSEAAPQQGVLWLRNIVKIERTHSSRKPYCLLLETKQRRFFLTLKSDEELYEWLHDVYSRSPLVCGSNPTNFGHNVHVVFDRASGQYIGMPEQWSKVSWESDSMRQLREDQAKNPVGTHPNWPLFGMDDHSLGVWRR